MVAKKKDVSASGNDVKILDLARKHGLSVEVVNDIIKEAEGGSE